MKRFSKVKMYVIVALVVMPCVLVLSEKITVELIGIAYTLSLICAARCTKNGRRLVDALMKDSDEMDMYLQGKTKREA